MIMIFKKVQCNDFHFQDAIIITFLSLLQMNNYYDLAISARLTIRYISNEHELGGGHVGLAGLLGSVH